MLRRMILTALIIAGISIVLITSALLIGTTIDTTVVAFDYPASLDQTAIILLDVTRWHHISYALRFEGSQVSQFVPKSSRILTRRLSRSISDGILYDVLTQRSMRLPILDHSLLRSVEWTTCGGPFAIIDYSGSGTRRDAEGSYRLNIETGEMARLTQGAGSHYRSWSPDRCQFVYSTRPDPDRVFISDVISGATYQLSLPFEEASIRAIWLSSSRIGLTVCDADEYRREGCDIFIHDLIAGLTEPILTRPESDFITSASPDGQWITYSSRANNVDISAAMMHIRTRETFVISEYGGGTASSDTTVYWSPDSQHLAAVIEVSGQSHVLRVFDVRGQVVLEQSSVIRQLISWSPDGDWLLHPDQYDAISLFNVRDQRRLIVDPANSPYLWLPDGRLMYHVIRVLGTLHFARDPVLLDLDSGVRRVLALEGIRLDHGDRPLPGFTDLALWD